MSFIDMIEMAMQGNESLINESKTNAEKQMQMIQKAQHQVQTLKLDRREFYSMGAPIPVMPPASEMGYCPMPPPLPPEDKPDEVCDEESNE